MSSVDAFISYKSEDHITASTLEEMLRLQGISCWRDTQLLAGSQYQQRIAAHLENAKSVVVLWSRQSVKSDWVLAEAEYGRTSGKLIPCLIEPTNIPPPFNLLDTLDLVELGSERAAKGTMKLMSALRKNAGLSESFSLSTMGFGSGDELIKRCGDFLHTVHQQDPAGNSTCALMVVLPHDEPAFLEALKSPIRSVEDLEAHGVMLCRCVGSEPNDEMRRYVRNRFGFILE